MSKMIRLHRQDPQKLTDYHLSMVAQSNVIAGFDTTAISLASTMYHLIRTPRVLKNLRDELNTARKHGKLSDRITFHESQDLPYFQAVLKEALRVHAATGLPFWRVVPEGGVEIEGLHFPEGTVLGANSWVSHNNGEIFDNPTEFCPERWIGQDKEKLKAMNEMYMPVSPSSDEAVFPEWNRAPKVRRLTIMVSVWSRRANLHWTTHLDLGNVKVDSRPCRQV
jgi:cytochrome P450